MAKLIVILGLLVVGCFGEAMPEEPVLTPEPLGCDLPAEYVACYDEHGYKPWCEAYYACPDKGAGLRQELPPGVTNCLSTADPYVWMCWWDIGDLEASAE